MLGAGLQFGRSHGDDRFYNPAKARRNRESQNHHSLDHLRRAQSDVTVRSQSVSANEKPVVTLESREREVSPLCNLDRFLQAVTPSVPAQYLSKTTLRGWRTCDVEFQPYFVLGDLWESFREWSAYGAGVPLVLDDSDSVVQYYVPFLSAIQIYVNPSKSSAKLRRPSEDSDGSSDSSSDGSSDSDHERCPLHFKEQHNHQHLKCGIAFGIDRLSMQDQHNAFQEGFSSDEGESGNPRGCLLFEYLERNQPHCREPLADKIANLALHFPELKTLRSCDLLSCSWISVAWYPIYRIPTGPTLKDLDACFLTFHSLHTPTSVAQSAQIPAVSYPNEMDVDPMISIPVSGLAAYKFKASWWTPNVGSDRQLLSNLLQDAEKLLSMLQVNHPDFLFFSRR